MHAFKVHLGCIKAAIGMWQESECYSHHLETVPATLVNNLQQSPAEHALHLWAAAKSVMHAIWHSTKSNMEIRSKVLRHLCWNTEVYGGISIQAGDVCGFDHAFYTCKPDQVFVQSLLPAMPLACSKSDGTETGCAKLLTAD